jgi:hypothetical protein
VGIAIGSKGYIGTGFGGSYKQDFWELDAFPLGNVYTSPASPTPTYSVSDGSWTKEGNQVYNSNTGNIGIGTNNPTAKLDVASTFKVSGSVLAPLKFENNISNRLLELYESANNDHQFYGFGINGNTLRYQVEGPIASHIFYAGVNSTSSIELMRISGNGNVGIGIDAIAGNRLDINNGATRSGTHPSGLPLYVTGALSAASNGIEFRHNNGLQGIGFGYNTIYATGSNATQDLGMSAKGVTGNLIFSTNGAERMRITGNGTFQFSSDLGNRKIVMWDNGLNNNHQFYGFGVQGSVLRYQVSNQDDNHIFYAATGDNSSLELLRISGYGNVTLAGTVISESYIAPTLLNNFTNYNGGFAPAGYYKDKLGIVHLHGLVNNAGNPNGLNIFVLPVGYRPSSGKIIFEAMNNNGVSRIDILTDGSVQVQSGVSGWFTLDQISFRAD